MDDRFGNNDFYGPSLFNNDEYNDEEEIDKIWTRHTARPPEWRPPGQAVRQPDVHSGGDNGPAKQQTVS